MEQQIGTEQINQVPADVQLFEQIAKIGDFEISPCKKEMNLEDKSSYRKLELTSAQKIQISGLLQQLPQATTMGMMAQSYTVRFPEGLPHTLTALKQGGFGSMIQGSSGSFAGSASFYSMSAQAAVMGAFTVLSAVTGQYFLAQITSELKQIGKKIDSILEFLYADKKSELLSEVTFVQNSFKNYISIMWHEEQRTATIGSLQQSQKVAIKDVEFYLDDFEKKINSVKDRKGFCDQADELQKAKECLELSLQLYVSSIFLEIYYAQNFDSEFISLWANSIQSYVKKCRDRISTAYNRLEGRFESKEDNFFRKVAKVKSEKSSEDPQISDLIRFFENFKESEWFYGSVWRE